MNRSLTLMHFDSTRSQSEPVRVRRSRSRFGAILSTDAVAVPFRLFRGGRMLIEARIEDPANNWRSAPLTLLLDTGASACALFDDAIRERAPRVLTWPRETGHVIHTVLGESPSDLVTLPRLRLMDAGGDVAPLDVEAGLNARGALPDIQGELPDPVHGLLGTTFLSRYRVVIDYADQTLWLLPRSESSPRATPVVSAGGIADAGLTIRRLSGEWYVTGWHTGSAAGGSGIATGDRVVSIDGKRIAAMESGAEALLAGLPGSQVMVVVHHEGLDRVFLLRRGSQAKPVRGSTVEPPPRPGEQPRH